MKAAQMNRTPGYNGRREMGSRSNTPTNYSCSEKRQNFSRSFMSGQLPEQNSYFTPRAERPPSRHSNLSVSTRDNGSHYERGHLYEVSSQDNRSLQSNRSRSHQDIPTESHSVHSYRSRSHQGVPSYVTSPRVRDMEPLTEPQYDGGVLSDDETGFNEERSQPLC